MKLTAKSLYKFYNAYKRRRVKPYLKSEAVPEQDDHAVVTLVGTNFNKIVKSKKKDVFVKFYAPWCGHCK